jgi:hypothetical protein
MRTPFSRPGGGKILIKFKRFIKQLDRMFYVSRVLSLNQQLCL